MASTNTNAEGNGDLGARQDLNQPASPAANSLTPAQIQEGSPAAIAAAMRALDQMEAALHKVETFEDVQKIKKAADALRSLYREYKTVADRAGEVRITADVIIGTRLAEQPKATRRVAALKSGCHSAATVLSSNQKEYSMTTNKKLEIVTPDQIDETDMSVQKPPKFSMDKFKSTRGEALKVETMLPALPYHRIAEAKDFVMLHDDEKVYWSPEACFVTVPIKGVKNGTLHLIDEGIAMRFLPPARVSRFRLALATKPNDVFFLCQVPSQNLDNTYNASALKGCEIAKTAWTQVTSLKAEGIEDYKVEWRDPSKTDFPKPKWPTETLDEIIGRAFEGRMIETEDHPGLLRLRGEKQQIS
jgi:hypothetical protein